MCYITNDNQCHLLERNKTNVTSNKCAILLAIFYRGVDKSLARIDNSYVKIKHIICLSAPLKFLRFCSKRMLFDLSNRLASNDTIDSILRHLEVGRAKDLSAPWYTYIYIYTKICGKRTFHVIEI